MGKCKICGVENNRLYDGKCVQCLSVVACEEEKEILDNEHRLDGLTLNQPIGDLMEFLRFGKDKFKK